MIARRLLLAGLAFAAVHGLGPAAVAAQGAFAGSAPVFVPGLYETESRNSAFRNEGIKSRQCLASADFDAFERDTIAQYLKAPQFKTVCKLSDPKRIGDGFAFAMDCGAAKTVISFHFATDLVSSVIETKIPERPEYSSSILTLSRRVGACGGQATGNAR